MEQPAFYTYSAQQLFSRTLKILRSRRDRLIKKRDSYPEDTVGYAKYQSLMRTINYDIDSLLDARDIIKEVLKEN